ncbi:MAG: nucleotidyltransferase family protein [Oceanospirillaceae bacterium]|nr:nucleotidyltransferase family protein [Oceanospirillaceae bacterium]
MSDKSRVLAVVLAAGRGRRFGRDKRREPLDDGKTLLRATLDRVSPHFAQVRVLLRPEDDAGALQVDSYPVVRSANADRGMGFSIADGFVAIRDMEAIAAAVLLGDMPCIEPETFRALLEHASADRIVRPEFHGRAGHPVIFGRTFWGELAGLEGEEGARSVIHRHPDACMHIEVDDPGVLMDADRPEDLEALRTRYRIIGRL